jgi:hypothetical protein
MYLNILCLYDTTNKTTLVYGEAALGIIKDAQRCLSMLPSTPFLLLSYVRLLYLIQSSLPYLHHYDITQEASQAVLGDLNIAETMKCKQRGNKVDGCIV